jgi:hypothetical protein
MHGRGGPFLFLGLFTFNQSLFFFLLCQNLLLESCMMLLCTSTAHELFLCHHFLFLFYHFSNFILYFRFQEVLRSHKLIRYHRIPRLPCWCDLAQHILKPIYFTIAEKCFIGRQLEIFTLTLYSSLVDHHSQLILFIFVFKVE